MIHLCSKNKNKNNLVTFRGNPLKCVDILCTQTSESCHNSWDNEVKIVYLIFHTLHALLVVPTLAWLKSACYLSNIFSLLLPGSLLSNQTHQTLCWCPVCWTNYGRLCSLYGNLCLIILWSFLHAVVLNMQHNGSYVAMACCVYLHDIKSPICTFTVILFVMF